MLIFTQLLLNASSPLCDIHGLISWISFAFALTSWAKCLTKFFRFDSTNTILKLVLILIKLETVRLEEWLENGCPYVELEPASRLLILEPQFCQTTNYYWNWLVSNRVYYFTQRSQNYGKYQSQNPLNLLEIKTVFLDVCKVCVGVHHTLYTRRR